MTTDPTVDAIAALEVFEDAADYYKDSEHGDHAVPIGLKYLRRAREVRSALLSAQGQAGKPVAWMRETLGGRALSFDPVMPEGWTPLYVQPQPAAGVTDALTTARTALKAAEKALRGICAPIGGNGEWLDKVSAARVSAASAAWGVVSSALATIKGLET